MHWCGSTQAFPFGESPQCAHWGIEGTAPKVKDQAGKTHLGTLFSQKRFRSAFFDSFPQGEAFAAAAGQGLFYRSTGVDYPIPPYKRYRAVPKGVTNTGQTAHALAEGPAFKLQFVVLAIESSGPYGVTNLDQTLYAIAVRFADKIPGSFYLPGTFGNQSSSSSSLSFSTAMRSSSVM